jgi:hypothetical protein
LVVVVGCTQTVSLEDPPGDQAKVLVPGLNVAISLAVSPLQIETVEVAETVGVVVTPTV